MADLSKLISSVEAILKEEWNPVLDMGSDLVQRRLKVIAEELVHYWELSRAGDATAEENLKYLKSEAELLVIRAKIAGARAARQTVERVLTVLAKVGLAVLKAAL